MKEKPISTPTAPAPKGLVDKIRSLLKYYWTKFTPTPKLDGESTQNRNKVTALVWGFYQNKKIFLPVSISVGLLFLVILVGLIFGGKRTPQAVKSTPSPTPAFIQNTSSPSTGTDTLSQIEQKLADLKNQIRDLDVKQSRLQPPALNFNIKF